MLQNEVKSFIDNAEYLNDKINDMTVSIADNVVLLRKVLFDMMDSLSYYNDVANMYPEDVRADIMRYASRDDFKKIITDILHGLN